MQVTQNQVEELEKENQQIRKELAKNKDYDNVKNLHQQLSDLRKQSFEELISLKRERDDLILKVQHMNAAKAKEVKNLNMPYSSSGKSRSKSRSEMSMSRERAIERANQEDSYRDEIKSLKGTVQKLKRQLEAAVAGERRLKEQLVNKDSDFEQERREMRALLASEKKHVIRIQENSLKIKDDFEKKRNSIIREMMEKEELIHKLSLEISEAKIQARRLETKEFETKLRENSSKTNIEKSFFDYDSNNEIQIKTSTRFGRSKSPLLNDRTISETVMYGGSTSVIDSIMGSFPQEHISVLASQDFATRHHYTKSREIMEPITDNSQDDISNISSQNPVCKSRDLSTRNRNTYEAKIKQVRQKHNKKPEFSKKWMLIFRRYDLPR